MPSEMHEHLVRHSLRTRYGSVSEYIRELIRKDQTSSRVPTGNITDEEAPWAGLFTVTNGDEMWSLLDEVDKEDRTVNA